MNKYLSLLLPLFILSACAIGPLVEVKMAEEGAKFVERDIEVTATTQIPPATKPIKK